MQRLDRVHAGLALVRRAGLCRLRRRQGGAKNGAAKTIKAEKPARATKPATADKPAKPAKAEQAEAEQAEAVVETTEAVVEVPLDAEADAIDEPSDTTVDDSEGEDEA